MRVIGRSNNLIVVRTAFRATIKEYSKVWVRLRNRCLVLEERKPS